MQQRLEPEPWRHPLQRLHDHHLVVAGDVAGLEQRRDLVLARGHLVVPRLHRHAETVELPLRLGHEGQDPGGNSAEVVVLELLALGRPGAEQGPLADQEVGPLEVELAVDQEVLLLRAHRGVDPAHALVGAEDLENPERLPRERLHRAQQRDLGVERLAGPGDERGGNAQGDVVVAAHEERGAGRVPGGVAAGLEGGADAAGGEARRIGLALHQLGAGEVEHHAAVAVGCGQRVVLLGGQAGEGLKPVRVVGRAVLDRPVLHGGRHDVGDRRVERLAAIDGAEQAAVDLLGKALPHHAAGEHVAAEDRIHALGRLGDGHGELRLTGVGVAGKVP